MKKRILIYGSGVIGSIYALRFAKAGHEVSVLARGDRLKALRERGVVIRQIFLDKEEQADVDVLDAIPSDRHFDIIIAAVRSGQVTSVLREIAKLPKPEACVVLGNNLGDFSEQESLAGPECFILGFGAFGGYREVGTIVYLDGRTKEKPYPENRSKTTLGAVSSRAEGALEMVREVFTSSGLPCTVCGDMPSWLLCHAALVFPLAGGMYAAGGDQDVVSKTRDCAVLGVRAARELLRALRSLGYKVLPKSLKSLLLMPEWFLVKKTMEILPGAGAKVAMFGHANAPGGRYEISGQALLLDSIVRKSGRSFHSWNRLLPYFQETPPPLIPEGSRSIRLKLY